MHQRLEGSRDEPVIDEDVLLDRQRRVLPLEVAGAITLDTRPERQILGPRRRSDRIRLHESKRVDRPCQSCWSPQAASDRHPTEIVKRRRGAGHQ
jgi:hypothetical protein